MDISSGNCRTGGGHARDENPAQTKSSKRIAEKGSEMAGFRSAASPAAFHEEAKEAEECAAHPVTHRRAAESGQHADVGADHTAADHQPPVLQGVAHAEHEPAASIGRPAAPHAPPMADDASQGEIRQNMPLENQSEPRKKGLKHGFKH